MRLALACAFLSAAVSIIGLLLSLIVVDNAISTSLDFPDDLLIEVTLPGQEQSPLASADVINTIRVSANQTLLARGLPIALFAGFLGGAAGYIIAARALGPLADVTAMARRISGGSLDERIALGGAHDELRDLADTFDAMLERLDRSFDAQRRFVSNASHELRTPLTVIRTEVDVTLADPNAPPEELRQMGEVVRDATERANSLVESLLALARIEAQVQHGPDTVDDFDLCEAIPLAIQAVRLAAQQRGVSIEVDAEPAPVRGDTHLLEQLVANLLTNAVRHNVEGGQVWITMRAPAQRVVLTVANTGRELDPSSVTELLRPFKRAADRTAASGTGLGLSIVDAIVRAHQGSIELQARPGGGLEVTVTLPQLPTTRSAVD